MAQFGMQMPASRARKGTTLSVYTVLAAIACLALAVGCAVMFVHAGKVGKDGNPWGIQDAGNIQLKK